MLFAAPSDVEALQTQVKQQGQALTASLRDCIKAGKVSVSTGAASDPTIWRDWKAMSKRQIAYLNIEVDWLNASGTYDAGIALLNDLQPWYARIDAAGCAAPPKPTVPTGPLKGEGLFSDWTGLVMVALVAFALHEAKGL